MKNKVIAFLFFIIGAAATAQQHAADTVTHGILQPTVVLCSTRPAPREVAAKSPVVTKSPIVSRLLTGEMLTDQHSAGVGLFTNFDSDDGLALDGITYGDKSSICDHQGNLWFGTIGGGVSKYDGQHFTTYTTNQGLGNNYVFSIAEDKDGNFWFGTDGGGVSKYDGQSFTTYTTSQGLGADIVLSILEDDAGNLWFGTHGGISKYDGQNFTTYTTAEGLANNSVLSLAEDRVGNLWIGTTGGVSKYDGHDFTNYTSADGLGSNRVRCITEDRNGNLWFGTNGGGGVSMYDGTSFITYTTAEGLGSNSVYCIEEDRLGNLWFGTLGGGVSEYDGKSFTTYTTSQGLGNNNVYSIVEDLGGNLWFGTNGGGVSRYEGKSFTTMTSVHGLGNNAVRCIIEDAEGNLWLGTDGGVSKYDGRGFAQYTTAEGLGSNSVYSIAQDIEGNLWFGTSNGGVSKYDGHSITNYTTSQGLGSNEVYSIAEDSEGNLWFGTDGGGASKYDGQSFATYTTRQGLGHDHVRAIFEDRQGNLWFGTDGGGVSKYDGQKFTTYTTAEGLANNSVLSIAEDREGNLWFGTYGGGINVISAKRLDSTRQMNEKVKFLSINVANGLPDDGICAIREDLEGRMIIGTNFGLAVIPASIVQTIAEIGELGIIEGLEIYNQFNGYPIKDVNTGLNNGSMCVDSKGLLWVGHGSNGITRVDLGAVLKNTNAPSVVLQGVKVNEENICWYLLGPNAAELDSTTKSQQENMSFGSLLTDKERNTLISKYSDITFDGITKFNPLPEHLVLPYAHNAVSFEFNANVTSRNKSVNYQYALEQLPEDAIDISKVKDWSPKTKKHEAVFNNLMEGDYTFILKAQSPEGIWSEPTLYGFTVSPPWYRTWWAYTTYGVLFLIALAAFVKWRERSLRLEKEKLEETVEIRTLELVAEKNRSEELLLNILPSEIAEELKTDGSAEAKMIEQVTVLFTDFKGFTAMSENLSAKDLVADLHECFSAFDRICASHGIEKIKTIGDAYMAAGGLPVPMDDSVKNTVLAAIEMQDFIGARSEELGARGLPFFEMRVGIHTGPVVAGIVGVKKFQYDLWGDTVNTASKMESAGEVGRVNISQTIYNLLKEDPAFSFEFRGKIEAKGKGEMEMWFVSEK